MADNYIEGYHIPIAHPGLMRMLDYKHYDVEVNDHYVWFEAPMRAKPSSNRLERLYAQMVTPMPGLAEEDRHVWRYAYIYPEHHDRPLPRPGQHLAAAPRRRRAHRRRLRLLPARRDRARAPAWCSGPTSA